MVLDDGKTKTKFSLNRSYYGLYIPTMTWRELENFSSGSVCLVLASEYYDPSDYYYSYDEFIKAVKEMKQIRFLDVGWTYQALAPKMDAAAKRVLESGWFIHGDEVKAFEKEFALYTGARHCIGCGNGLEAIELVLRAAEVGPGDDVLVPSNTFIATWLAVTRTGANIVPVEPMEATYNMDPAKLEEALTPATKAIIPVHLYGQPADMDPIMEFAEKTVCLLLLTQRRHTARFTKAVCPAHWGTQLPSASTPVRTSVLSVTAEP